MVAARYAAFALALAACALASCSGGGSASPPPLAGGSGASGSTPAPGTTATPAPGTTPGTTPAPSPAPTGTPASHGVVPLGSYAIDPSKVFVAGISSGGFFGVQMHVAHSATFKGAAIYAGGVYWCSGAGQAAQALTACGGEGLYAPMLTPSETYLDQQSASGTIDPESNLQGQPVYLWSGTADTVVKQAAMNDLQTEYQHYGARIVRYDNAFPAEHGWESPDGELPCGTAASPYMIRCTLGTSTYDSESVWMTAFFGTLAARNNGTLSGTLLNVDQTAFGAGASNSMDTNGYLFVPADCAAHATCGLLIAFHGCLQTQADIGTKFVTESGIDEWADRNHVVVLYPYAVKSTTVPYNPQGCWDWWGYDDENYATKSGTQISIVYKMVQHVMGH
ncbi:MAG TPA: PHB depolymerase family esterase [Candidatus Elarobacter sp.]|jgi:poly(3-hydroxybutyrate) depolymerase|nr:PHB depolymerase family esterase [Candidatus Elarobacter sp.]